jgi:hypothetical protein
LGQVCNLFIAKGAVIYSNIVESALVEVPIGIAAGPDYQRVECWQYAHCRFEGPCRQFAIKIAFHVGAIIGEGDMVPLTTLIFKIDGISLASLPSFKPVPGPLFITKD